MEDLGVFLQSHSQQLQNLVMAMSCVKLLLRGQALVFLRKSEEHGDTVCVRSLLSDLLLAILGMRLAQLSGDQTRMKINGTSLVLDMGFLGIFYHHAAPSCRCWIWRKMLLVVLLMVICLWYSVVVEPATVNCHLSILMTGITALLMAMGQLQQSGAVFSCTLSILGGVSKLLYALSVPNTLMVYQNLFVLCLDLLRLVLSLKNPQRERSAAAVSAAASSTSLQYEE